MVWELIAIWAIVIATIVWFVRDERREQSRRLEQQAIRFATGSAWRHREPAAPRPAFVRAQSSDLTDVQRKFLEEMRRQRELDRLRGASRHAAPRR